MPEKPPQLPHTAPRAAVAPGVARRGLGGAAHRI